jgi:hypothetical protein
MPSVVFVAECIHASKHREGSWFVIPIRCSSSDKSIDVGFLTKVGYSVALRDSISSDLSAADVASLLAQALLEEISQRRMLDIYRVEEFFLQELRPTVEKAHDMMTSQKEVAESLAFGFRSATRIHRTAEGDFNRAKMWLVDHSDSLRAQSARARSAVRFLVACLKASADLDVAAVNAEAVGFLERHSGELMKRKDPGHSHYISLADRLRSDVLVLQFPSFWSAPPPAPESLNL